MARHADGSLALLLLGALALGRAWWLARPPPAPWEAGEPILLRVEDLEGDAFRLLPGVGPALAERLEAARAARAEAGAKLTKADLDDVRGVGPALLRRWEPLWAR